MWKKTLTIVLFIGLLALLIVGGINRTQAQLASLNEVEAAASGETAVSDHETEAVLITASEWQPITAEVTEVRSNGLWLTADEVETMRVRRMAWEMATRAGFTAVVGDTVLVYGYWQGTQFEIDRLVHPDTGVAVSLRGEDGSALWESGE